ncbi:hypothetical protein ETH_00033885, partial [Eimeria tenella]
MALGYQALADAAVQQRESSSSSDGSSSGSSSGAGGSGNVLANLDTSSSSSSSSSSSKMKKSLGFPHYASVFRRLFAAVSALGNRADTAVEIALSCVAAASCCCSKPFLCMLLSYSLPQHSVSALLATLKGDEAEAAAALVAAPAPVCCFGPLTARCASQLTLAAQQPVPIPWKVREVPQQQLQQQQEQPQPGDPSASSQNLMGAIDEAAEL